MIRLKEYNIRIDLPVWNYELNILYTSNIILSVENRFNLIEGKVDEHTKGLHVNSPDTSNCFIIINSESSEGTIAHEVFHALWEMFKYKGAEFENETYAYHLSYLVDKVTDFKKRCDKLKTKYVKKTKN